MRGMVIWPIGWPAAGAVRVPSAGVGRGDRRRRPGRGLGVGGGGRGRVAGADLGLLGLELALQIVLGLRGVDACAPQLVDDEQQDQHAAADHRPADRAEPSCECHAGTLVNGPAPPWSPSSAAGTLGDPHGARRPPPLRRFAPRALPGARRRRPRRRPGRDRAAPGPQRGRARPRSCARWPACCRWCRARPSCSATTSGPTRRAVRRRVGLLGHATMLYEELTVADNVRFWARAAKARPEDADAAMAELGLDGRLPRRHRRPALCGSAPAGRRSRSWWPGGPSCGCSTSPTPGSTRPPVTWSTGSSDGPPIRAPPSSSPPTSSSGPPRWPAARSPSSAASSRARRRRSRHPHRSRSTRPEVARVP